MKEMVITDETTKARSIIIQTRLNGVEYDELQSAADRLGMTIAAYIRHAIFYGSQAKLFKNR